MYIELLEQYAKNIEYSVIQPPPTKDEVSKAEKELNIVFPDELKEFLSETNGDNFLLHSLDYIVKNNFEFRALNPEIIEPELFDFSQFLFIAGNGCGDYYGYKIEDNEIRDSSIFVFDHEEYSSELVASNIAELIKLYYQDKI